MNKLVGSIKEAITLCGLEDGMTVSFHHHLRNGDHVLNMVMQTIEEMGFKNIKVAASSIFPVHEPLIHLIKEGVVTSLDTNYVSGPLARAISSGILKEPVVFHSHGGRAGAIESGRLPIDIAFIASPAADDYGNLNGVDGYSACGALSYAVPDAHYAKKVVAITDCLKQYPLNPISIEQCRVDYVVQVDSIGDPEGIVSGTTKVTKNPVGLTIAKYAAKAIEQSGLLKDGFSFQTGAGGTSLAVAHYLSQIMQKKQIQGSFGLGGITGYFVDLLEQRVFEKLLDVQSFDLKAISSLKENPRHHEISVSSYANPLAKGCAVDKLDVVILGATEIDTSFNVNVHTDSNGIIIGGSGGHCDAAAGANISLIVAPLWRARLPVIVDRVMTISTPGSTVDVLVTERGLAVNPQKPKLKERLKDRGLPVYDIHELKEKAEKVAGVPERVKINSRIVAKVEYRDGSLSDYIRQVL
jgi:citrate lyase subunit alpha/citrate CoA-transferase